MIYLILAILFSSTISVLMRVSERYAKNAMAMLAMNYLMCAFMGVMLVGPANMFPAQEGLTQCLWLGVLNGFIYLGSFLLLRWNVSRNGVVLSNMFMRLGVLVPTLMSILLFGESPSFVQILGVVLALTAICLIQGKREEGVKAHMAGLLILLLAGGMADGMSKIFEELGPAFLKNQFLAYTFIIALVLCVLACLVTRQRLTLMDALFGLAIGVPNYLSSRFLLYSISQVPAVVAYPSYSVGTIVLVTLMGVLIFREKLDKRKLIALGIIMAALVMLNL